MSVAQTTAHRVGDDLDRAPTLPDRARTRPSRWAWARAGVGLALAVGGVACDGGLDVADDDGPDGPRATVLAEVDVQAWCDMVGVEQIALRARMRSCLEAAPDCDVGGEVPGDRISCPVTSRVALMGVDVTAPAVYLIEVERVRAADGPQVDCLAGPEGSTTWEIGPDAIAASARLEAMPDPGPCPES